MCFCGHVGVDGRVWLTPKKLTSQIALSIIIIIITSLGLFPHGNDGAEHTHMDGS